MPCQFANLFALCLNAKTPVANFPSQANFPKQKSRPVGRLSLFVRWFRSVAK
jgi:hypothetical protein